MNYLDIDILKKNESIGIIIIIVIVIINSSSNKIFLEILIISDIENHFWMKIENLIHRSNTEKCFLILYVKEKNKVFVYNN